MNRILGYINIDFSIDILDILMLVDFIVLDSSPNISQLFISDCNGDSVIDILDIMLIINLVLES